MRSSASTTPTTRAHWPRSVRTPRRWRCPAPSGGTASGGCFSTGTAPSSSAESGGVGSMSVEAPGHVAAPSPAALGRVLRYLLEELGRQHGPAGVGLARRVIPKSISGRRDQGSGDRLAGGAVEPEGGAQGEQPLGDPGADPGQGPPAVQLQVELALEGIVDRLDELADRGQQLLTGRGARLR